MKHPLLTMFETFFFELSCQFQLKITFLCFPILKSSPYYLKSDISWSLTEIYWSVRVYKYHAVIKAKENAVWHKFRHDAQRVAFVECNCSTFTTWTERGNGIKIKSKISTKKSLSSNNKTGCEYLKKSGQ